MAAALIMSLVASSTGETLALSRYTWRRALSVDSWDFGQPSCSRVLPMSELKPSELRSERRQIHAGIYLKQFVTLLFGLSSSTYLAPSFSACACRTTTNSCSLPTKLRQVLVSVTQCQHTIRTEADWSAASPFVIAVQIAGIKHLPDVVNASLLVFVVSAANSGKFTMSVIHLPEA